MTRAALLPDRDESDGHLENSEDDCGDDLCGEMWLSHTGMNGIKVEVQCVLASNVVTSRETEGDALGSP
jgi:hypothetical protein